MCLKRLVDKLDEWIKILEIPALGKYNIHESDFNKIIKEGGQKNNPINLTPNDIKKILSLRL